MHIMTNHNQLRAGQSDFWSAVKEDNLQRWLFGLTLPLLSAQEHVNHAQQQHNSLNQAAGKMQIIFFFVSHQQSSLCGKPEKLGVVCRQQESCGGDQFSVSL